MSECKRYVCASAFQKTATTPIPSYPTLSIQPRHQIEGIHGLQAMEVEAVREEGAEGSGADGPSMLSLEAAQVVGHLFKNKGGRRTKQSI